MLDSAFLAALNHLLEGAQWARARLASYVGRRARFDIPPFDFGFEITAEGMVTANPEPAMTDVVIRLPAETPFLLPQGLDKVMAQATVEGNAEFATELSFIFRNLRWDAEEDLSRLFGDIVAHRLVQGANRFMSWHRQAATRLAENVTEYLTLEQSVLVPRAQLSELREQVARLDADLSRAESRLNALTR